MKLSRVKIWATALAIASLTTLGMAQTDQGTPPPPRAHMHHHAEMSGGPMLPFFSKSLDLTDAQRTQIKQIFHNAKPAMKPLMEQEHQSHLAMVQLITSGNFDQGKAQTIAAQESQVRMQLEVQHALLASQAYQVLTAEQKTKLNKLIAEHQQRMEERMKQRQQAAPEEAPNQ